MSALLEVRLDQIEQRRPLREHERLVPLGDRLLERLEQPLDLRRRLGLLARARAPEWHAAWRRRSSASSAASTPPPVRQLLGDVLLRRDADGVVDAALGLVELDVKHRVGARRQLGQHLALRAAQDERADLGAEPRRRTRGCPFAMGVAVALLEVARAAEQAGVREVHRAPELFEAVLDRRAAERDAELSAQLERGARGLAPEVLDGLRLVEDDDVPRLPARGARASRRSRA